MWLIMNWFLAFRAVHLSNVAIQQYYANGQRNENLPDNNFWTSEQFSDYLK